ncbi:hypothetical protein STENM223S_10106 [Streptomyces tendae]
MAPSAVEISRTTAYAVSQSAPPPRPAGVSRVSRPASRSRDTSSTGAFPACSRMTVSVARSSAASRATRSQCARPCATGSAGDAGRVGAAAAGHMGCSPQDRPRAAAWGLSCWSGTYL